MHFMTATLTPGPGGSWGRYTSADAAVVTAEAGRQFLTSFVRRQGEHLKKHLDEACRIRGLTT